MDENTAELHTWPVQQLVTYCLSRNIHRFHIVYDRAQQQLVASHVELQPLADFFNEETRDFDRHEGLFFQINNTHQTLQGAFVHRTVRGQAAGGVRYWSYPSVEAYMRDGLRLAKGMTHKNALAGIWWGGGKGVIAHNPAIEKNCIQTRADLYTDYGRLMSAIKGCYVTAEDAGTHVTDMENIFSHTRFTTCIPPKLGGSGNPSLLTAKGVVCGMEAASEYLQLGALAGKVIAIQGVGNVGRPLIEFLLAKDVKHIIACDVNAHHVAQCQQQFATDRVSVSVSQPGCERILAEDCDILAPCAVGGILHPQSIATIKAAIVCGAANNQLEKSERDDQLLHE